MRAAILLLRGDYFGRPFDDGPIRCLLELGFDIDVYTPGDDQSQSIYPPTVRRRPVTYTRSWLFSNLGTVRSTRYDLFLGTADLPAAFAWIFAALTGKPMITLCDEIFTGGHRGDASPRWIPIVRHAMRRADLTVIPDACRVPLQRAWSGLPASHTFVEVPCAYDQWPPIPDRLAVRDRLHIPATDFVVSLSGSAANEEAGAHWVVRMLSRMPPHYRVLLQTGGHSGALADTMLAEVARHARLTHLGERTSWPEAFERAAACDVGLALYLSPKEQFQLAGLSSNKLCMYLRLGRPVVASRQESFRFIEEFECGVLVHSEDELLPALARIEAGYEPMARNARRCFEEYVNPAAKRGRLTSTIRGLVGR